MILFLVFPGRKKPTLRLAHGRKYTLPRLQRQLKESFIFFAQEKKLRLAHGRIYSSSSSVFLISGDLIPSFSCLKKTYDPSGTWEKLPLLCISLISDLPSFSHI